MSYLLDKNTNSSRMNSRLSGKNKIIRNISIVLVFLVLAFFRSSIFSGFSYLSHSIFRPVFLVGNNIGDRLKTFGSYFASKGELYNENLYLKSEMVEDRTNRANYDSVVAENMNLKEILGRQKPQLPTILSAILAKPNQSSYDTILIDVGLEQGIKIGNIVFARGNIPIGRIAEVYQNSSKVILFSTSGENTRVVVMGKPEISNTDEILVESTTNTNAFLETVGRGGGNFEMIIPRDFKLNKGDQVVLPGINPYVIGVVETIISEQRDSFQKVLLVSPVNIQSIKFVEVEK